MRRSKFVKDKGRGAAENGGSIKVMGRAAIQCNNDNRRVVK